MVRYRCTRPCFARVRYSVALANPLRRKWDLRHAVVSAIKR